MTEKYNFKYLPLTGKLPGKSMVEQTEAAINELAEVVFERAGDSLTITELTEIANTALNKATQALETSGRTYLTITDVVNVNDYCDSELYYIFTPTSANLPVAETGFLEVKTNDDKTACEQVFIADSTGTPYYRHGRITKQTVGKKTTYVVTWSSWYRGATTEYVQAELQDYLPLSGGTVTGGLTVEGTITGNLAGNADTATNATNDANGNPIASTYLPLSGGTLTGVVNGVTPTAGDNSTKIATTEFVNAKAGNYLPLSGGTVTGGLTVEGTITGNLAGNADTATNATNATNATKDSAGNVITTTYLPIMNNAGAHNSIYRGKYLGDHVTDEQYDAIDAGTFEGLFIGDYWVINGVNWRIAAFDYWLHCGDTECKTHHVVIVPDTNLATCQMNNSNVTTGAYIGSDYYTGANSNTGKATANTAINNAFGSSHILTHREYLQNAVTNGYESGGAWYDSKFELMTERMVYGCDIFHNTMNGTNIPNWYSIDKSQMPLFALEPSRITNRANWWLRDVASAEAFARVAATGIATDPYASSSLGVRPAFAIKK